MAYKEGKKTSLVTEKFRTENGGLSSVMGLGQRGKEMAREMTFTQVFRKEDERPT